MVNPLRSAPNNRLQRIAGPYGIVLFGITDGLSWRKTLPTLYDLTSRGLLPPSSAVIGVARRVDPSLPEKVEAAIREGASTSVAEAMLK